MPLLIAEPRAAHCDFAVYKQERLQCRVGGDKTAGRVMGCRGGAPGRAAWQHSVHQLGAKGADGMSRRRQRNREADKKQGQCG